MKRIFARPRGAVSQIFYVSESLLMDCYYIANQSRPNNAEAIYSSMAQEVNDGNHILFAYKANDYLYGFVKGHLSRKYLGAAPEAKIDWLFVEPGCQRGGIGTQLVAAYEQYCIQMGAGRVSVQPAPTIQAKNFYAKCGYAPAEVSCLYVKNLGR